MKDYKFNSHGLLCLVWKKKPSLDRNVDSEKLKRQLCRIFDLQGCLQPSRNCSLQRDSCNQNYAEVILW